MYGQENLLKYIDHPLKSGLVQSFYLNGELSCLINVTFLKFENIWLSVVCTDEQTIIRIETDDIDTIKFYGDDEFHYPLTPIEDLFPLFKKYKNKKLIGFKELGLTNPERFSFGINLYFEDNLNFMIINHDYPIDKNEYLFSNSIPSWLKEK